MTKEVEKKQTIHILPEKLINKIAAGEVIDRPASVLKELVENSIDAGAKQITIIVKGGGSALIQVIDDGCGMSEDDAILSLQRHATSKIRTYEDIEAIRTLGFRGEALASIAAVSRLELKTILQGSIEGTVVYVEGGVVQRVDRTGGNPGTNIAVKNLFFNTPARRKFLRAEATEYRYLLGMLNRFTLAFPEITFRLIHEDKEVFHYGSTSLLERIGDVLGSRVRHNLLTINEEHGSIKISGFIGNYDLMRKSRNDQYIFLNRRYINDRTLSYAITSGFGDQIPKGLYPLFIIFLEIDPKRVDVNVHPTKNEVKFADSRLLYDLVRNAVRRAMRTDDVIPTMQKLYPPTFRPSTSPPEQKSFAFTQTELQLSGEEEDLGMIIPSEVDSESSSAIVVEREETPPTEMANVWQLQKKYIVAQIKSGLVVIDQHVAHERILYDRAKKCFAASQGASQQLLFPQTLELSAQDFQYLQEIAPLLEKIGFMLKTFGGRTVVVEGVPTGVRIGSEDKLLLDIIDAYRENQEGDIDLHERVAKSFACRSAVMAGESLSVPAMNALIDQLFATENPYFCPHGRPIMVTISVEEIDRRFERK